LAAIIAGPAVVATAACGKNEAKKSERSSPREEVPVPCHDLSPCLFSGTEILPPFIYHRYHSTGRASQAK
jgi:hypothetical protein